MTHNNREKFKAVAFDLDGLMVNTEDIYDAVLDRVLTKRGLRFDLELKRSLMGLKAADAFAVLKARFDIPDTAACLQHEVEQLFDEFMHSMLRPLPGLDRLLGLVDELALPRCVATSSPRSLAFLTLRRAKLERGFQFVLTGDDIANGKPAPDMYLMAASRFGIDPREMLVFEDSLHGTQAASASGAFTIAVPGSHSRGLDFSHVDLVASTLFDEAVVNLFGNPNSTSRISP